MALVVAPDPVARGEPPDGRPNVLDDPGHVPPHDEGEGQVLRQLATANQGVHRIDANRGGLDEHVRRADRGGGPFAEPNVLRRADAVDVGGFHGSNPSDRKSLRLYASTLFGGRRLFLPVRTSQHSNGGRRATLYAERPRRSRSARVVSCNGSRDFKSGGLRR